MKAEREANRTADQLEAAGVPDSAAASGCSISTVYCVLPEFSGDWTVYSAILRNATMSMSMGECLYYILYQTEPDRLQPSRCAVAVTQVHKKQEHERHVIQVLDHRRVVQLSLSPPCLVTILSCLLNQTVGRLDTLCPFPRDE